MSAHWSESGKLKVRDKWLEYACYGPEPDDAPTVVLLHEGLGCTHLWREFPKELSKSTGYGVFAYSRAGYGQSDLADLPRPLDYMTREAVEVLPDVLDFIGVKQSVLLGHSDGATIAAIHAGSVIDPAVTGVILMAPHFFTEPVGLAQIAQARDAFDRGDLRKRMEKYHRDPDNAFRGWNDSWLNPDFKQWNVSATVDAIQVPVLAIQGRQDPYGTLAQIDVLTHRVQSASVSTLILNDCMHAPHLEQGPSVLAAIAAFCEGECALRTGTREKANG
ncbi:MAG: alpha/beta fold hydrolase [Granulosicoccus sp.]